MKTTTVEVTELTKPSAYCRNFTNLNNSVKSTFIKNLAYLRRTYIKRKIFGARDRRQQKLQLHHIST